ncbi:MAG: glycosyltransferase [Rhodospirillaceae bacterium]|nr:glycosyltransferase [Rhodospirillaceae bacterium]
MPSNLAPVEKAPSASFAAGQPRIRVEGKFLFAGAEKFFLRGVTYGPFAPAAHGSQFPAPPMVDRDFALMVELGANTLRVFTVPPRWLLDRAAAFGLRVLVGLPWTQHVAFLDSDEVQDQIRRAIVGGVAGCKGHPAVLAYLIGNEISPDIIRWHGADKVRRFLGEIAELARATDPGALISYANFPSTEYLPVDFADFLAFNVYLHREADYRRYLARLHNLAVDRPVVLTEFGIDSLREGVDIQAKTLAWQIKAAFESGVAGCFVFSWTDEWFTGGFAIPDWAFGLVDAERRPKPAFAAVQAQYRAPLPPALPAYPKVSVIVCAYNADRTMAACLESMERLNYPNYEIVIVNDGSTDRTREISERHPSFRLINQENKGLSVARNVGFAASSGDIIAYTDSDCVADPDWLTYLVAKFQTSDCGAVGGPNFPPPEDALIPSVVAVSPGGPTHVLLDDQTAEHIAGCNMAFRREVLDRLGGFDPIFRAAGDDVDICWRVQNAGYVIGFSPAAVVWHFRRNTLSGYIGQQRGYGKAEAMVYKKHPQRFNAFGQASWAGRIYGDMFSAITPGKPAIYGGIFGSAPFQSLYERPTPLLWFLPLTLEWNIAAALLFAFALIDGGYAWFGTLPLMMSWGRCLHGAWRAPLDPRFRDVRARLLVALLIYLGPLLRGWERTRWRIRGFNGVEALPLESTRQPARFSLRGMAMNLSYWTDSGREKDALLKGIIEFLIRRKYFVVIDEGWSDYDLKIARGVWARAFIRVGVENHGSGKRLFRVRCALRPSRIGKAVLGGCAILAALGAATSTPMAAAAAVAAAAVCLGVVVYQNQQLGGILHQVSEIVAHRLSLVRVGADAPRAMASQKAVAPAE